MTCEKCGGVRSSVAWMACGGCLAKARGETPRKIRQPTAKELARAMKFLGVTWNGESYVPVYGEKKRKVSK